MTAKSPTPPVPGPDLVSRRRLLANLGWTGAASGLLGAGPLPDFGELRLPEIVAAARGAAPLQSDAIRLNSNENPHGMCARARERMVAEADNVNRYPFAWEAELHAEIARLHEVSEGNIALGAGSTEILRMCVAAWVGSKAALLQADPTFETLGAYTRSAGHAVQLVPLDAAGRHDLDRMADRVDDETGVVYICNPSNPSSTLVPQAQLDAFLDALPDHLIVLVDEAYHHFVQASDYRSQIGRAMRSSNVIVIRTFSKVYGMAGLRVGYAVGAPERMRELQKPRTEMSISVIGAACAAESLRDSGYVADQRRLNDEARRVLTDGFDAMGVSYWQSETNFVMAHLGRPMMPVNAAMAERGVLVGRLFPALPNHLRISVGTSEQMHRCIDALGTVMAGV